MLWEDELPRRRFIRRTKVFLGFRLGNYGFWWREGVVLSLAKWEEALQHQKGKLNRRCVSARERQGAGDAWLRGAFLLSRDPSLRLAGCFRSGQHPEVEGREGWVKAAAWRRGGGAREAAEWGVGAAAAIAVISAAVAIAGGAAVTSARVWDQSPRVWICCRHRLRSSGGLTIGQKKIQVSPISVHFYWRGILYCLYYWVEQEYHFNMRVFSNSLCFTSQVFTAVLFYLPLAEHRGGEIRSWPPVAFLFPPEEVSWSSIAHVT